VKKIDNETIIGGICASIAIVAILIEMSVNNFSNAAIAAGAKDIATTLVAVLVFLFAVKNLWPKKIIETYDSVLENEFKKLMVKFVPLLNKGEVDSKSNEATINLLEKIHRYNLLTDFNQIFRSDKDYDALMNQVKIVNSSGSKSTFLDFEKKLPKSCFFKISETAFGNRYRGSKKPEYAMYQNMIASDMAACINAQFKGFCRSNRNNDGIQVFFDKDSGLNTPDDARNLARLTEYVLMLFMIKYQVEE